MAMAVLRIENRKLFTPHYLLACKMDCTTTISMDPVRMLAQASTCTTETPTSSNTCSNKSCSVPCTILDAPFPWFLHLPALVATIVADLH